MKNQIATTNITKTITAVSTAFLLAASVGCSTQKAVDAGNDRMTYTSSGLVYEPATSTHTFSNSGSFSAFLITPTITPTIVAQLSPPTVAGVVTQANAITFSGSKAYVGYNNLGSGTTGGIDVIDFTTPATPAVTSSVTFADTDINGLNVSGSDLYAVGGDQNGALLKHWTLSSGNLSGTPSSQSITGITGLGVVAGLLNVFVVSGDNGGLTTLTRSTLVQNNYSALSDARDVSMATSGLLSVVTGYDGVTPAKVYSTSGLSLVSASTTTGFTGAVNDEGKSSVLGGANYQIATAGQGGTNVICTLNQTITNNIPIPSDATLPAAVKTSNSAAFGGGFIFVANGAAGINVYSLEATVPATCIGTTVTFIGRISFTDGQSANGVAYSGGNLIVATGLGGFKIVTLGISGATGLLGTL